MQSFWYTGGPEMLASGEKARRQLDAVTGLAGDVSGFAKQYIGYAKDKRKLRQQVEDEEERSKAEQQMTAPQGLESEEQSGSEGGVTTPAPTVSTDPETGAITSDQSEQPGWLSQAATALLAPWGLADDPERRGLLRRQAVASGRASRVKSRDKIMQTYIPVAAEPGKVVHSAYPELPDAGRYTPPQRLSKEAIYKAAEAGEVWARNVRDRLQQDEIARRNAGGRGRAADPEKPVVIGETNSRTLRMGGGDDEMTFEIPPTDALTEDTTVAPYRKRWLEAHPDWVKANAGKSPPYFLGPPTKRKQYGSPSAAVREGSGENGGNAGRLPQPGRTESLPENQVFKMPDGRSITLKEIMAIAAERAGEQPQAPPPPTTPSSTLPPAPSPPSVRDLVGGSPTPTVMLDPDTGEVVDQPVQRLPDGRILGPGGVEFTR